MRLIDERELIARIAELPDLRTMNTATIGAIIKACQTVDAEPVRHGRWRHKVDGIWWPHDITCSECAVEYSFYKPPKYCPNCGAKMDLEG